MALTPRISNVGEAINVLSFNVNFPFHSQKSISRFFCDASVPISNVDTEVIPPQLARGNRASRVSEK